MEQEIVAYLRNESLEDLQRLLDTGITEDVFYLISRNTRRIKVEITYRLVYT